MYIYEHPLTEKIRTYLRVESLLQGIDKAAAQHETLHYQVFFRDLFDLLELLEQFQLKQELKKDLEKLRQKYQTWLNVPDVNQEALNQALDQINDAREQLKNVQRFGTELREDRYLINIRQRFYTTKGLCSFDMPMAYHWIHLPLEKRQHAVNGWLQHLVVMKETLALCLSILRNTSELKPLQAKRGLYQNDGDDSQLLRLEVPISASCYPMISGSPQRFSIKFILFDSGEACMKDIDFKLAVC